MIDEDTFTAELLKADQFSKDAVSHVNDEIAFHSIRNLNRGRSVKFSIYIVYQLINVTFMTPNQVNEESKS